MVAVSCGLTLQICLIIALSFCCRRWRQGFVQRIIIFYCSFHLSVSIDVAVAAVLSVFTAALKLVPKFKAHGGSVRENLALQNVQV